MIALYYSEYVQILQKYTERIQIHKNGPDYVCINIHF